MKTHEEVAAKQDVVEIHETKEKETDFNCRFDGCIVQSATLKELIDHMLTIHHGTEKKCTMCSNTPVDRNKLRLHYYAVHLKLKPYVCKKCGMTFGKKSGAQRHLRAGVCDGMKKDDDVNDLIATDEVMEKLEFFNEDLHEKEYNPKFFCEPCSQGFRYQWSFDKHMREIHEGLREHQCADCGKEFTTPS